MPNALNVDAVKFPVLAFSGVLVELLPTPNALTICKKAALKNGWFDQMLIVDADGKGYNIRGARKIHGVGRFSGYDIFLNQTIRVELLTEGGSFPVSLDDVKSHVMKSFKEWHLWESTGIVEVLTDGVTAARSIAEIQGLLSEV